MAPRKGLIWLVALTLGACSQPTDVTSPGGTVTGGINSTDASGIVLTIATDPTPSGFAELDTVTISAAVLTSSGSLVSSGEVTFTAAGNVLEQRGPRSAKLRLRSGANVVNATFRNARRQILQTSLTISAKPAPTTEIAVVWQADGSTTEIPRPANVRSLYPKAINDRGEVVGTAQLASGGRAFIWSEAAGFRIISSAAEDYSEGEDINDDGIVAGYRRIVTAIEGFLWSPLSGFVPIRADSEVVTSVGINNSGVVAGGRNRAAVIWTAEGGVKQLATPAGTQCSGTLAIAGSGYVLGWASAQFDDGWCLHWSPILWEPNGTMHVITECSDQLDCSTQVVDVNSAGEVIGNKNGRPFRWSLAAGFRELLGDASGIAMGSNDRGEVAGAIDYPFAMPIVWGPDNHMRILGIPEGRTVGTAYALNNKGQVVGLVK